MRIKTDFSYLNALVRQLLTVSAAGFVALAVILTFMSAALQYRVVPSLMRQLDCSKLGGIGQIYRLPPLVVAYQAPEEATTPGVQAAYAELSAIPRQTAAETTPPSANETSLDEKPHPDNNGSVKSAAAAEAKILRDTEKKNSKD